MAENEVSSEELAVFLYGYGVKERNSKIVEAVPCEVDNIIEAVSCENDEGYKKVISEMDEDVLTL